MTNWLALLALFVAAPLWSELPSFSQEEMGSYLLPPTHSLTSALDRIFSNQQVLRNQKTFKKAGFTVLHRRPSSMLVASHPKLPGYLVKVYPQSSRTSIERIWENFADRCRGADQVRKLIQREHIQHFTVADKWIYLTPTRPILVVTDMKTVSKQQSKEAWQNNIDRGHVNELYILVRMGLASTSLPSNIPYTKNGTFAFVDTERLNRAPLYDHARHHIAPYMQPYWERLVNQR